MYEELIKSLRCNEEVDVAECFECNYGKNTVCCNTAQMMIDAADIIEEQSKKIDFLMDCIYEAEDALDRGTDNDWARAALEKAERGQEKAND